MKDIGVLCLVQRLRRPKLLRHLGSEGLRTSSAGTLAHNLSDIDTFGSMVNDSAVKSFTC